MTSEIQLAGTEVLLDRKGVPKQIDRDLGEHVDYLATLSDWGVQLLKRSLERYEATPPNVVLFPTLYRQVLSFLDSLHIHLREGAVHAATPSLRSLWEATLSIEWILKNGKERWGRQFYVSELRQRRSWAAMAVPGTPEYQDTKDLGDGALKELLNDPEKQTKAKKQVRQIEKHLNQHPELKQLNDEFDKLKQKLDREPDWYRPKGPSSRADMAARLGRDDEYNILYRHWSDVAHGSRSRHHWRLDPDARLVIEPIRTIAGLDEIFHLGKSFGERATRLLTKEFEPSELSDLSDKIVEEWSEQRAMPKIEVDQRVIEAP